MDAPESQNIFPDHTYLIPSRKCDSRSHPKRLCCFHLDSVHSYMHGATASAKYETYVCCFCGTGHTLLFKHMKDPKHGIYAPAVFLFMPRDPTKEAKACEPSATSSDE